MPQGRCTAPRHLRQLLPGSAPRGVEIPGGVVQIGGDDSQDTPIVQSMYTRGAYPSQPVSPGLIALLCKEPWTAPA